MKNNEAPLEPAAVTTLLRNNIFKLKIEDIGLTHSAAPLVWGVMMELGYQDVVVSLVVMADGSCSVYLTDGTGIVGCGLYSEVRQAAANMLSIAQRMVPQCHSTVAFPLPTESRAQFYLLTSQGVLNAEAARYDLDEGATDLAELYYAGHTIIDMIELLGAGVDIVDEIHLAEAELEQQSAEAGSGTHAAARSRGRTCRILPTVGSAARRWHN